MASAWFRAELYLGDRDPMATALRWRRLARNYARAAMRCTSHADLEDALQAARECREVAAECWSLALRRRNAPKQPEPPPHRMPIGRAELNRRAV